MRLTLAIITTSILPKDMFIQLWTRILFLFYGLAEYSKNFKLIFDWNITLCEDVYDCIKIAVKYNGLIN